MTLGIAMLASALTSGTTTVAAVAPVVEMVVPADTVSAPVETETLTTEEQVREYFGDIPILAEVAFCESRFRQFNGNGAVLRGVQNPADVGVMQINETYHAATAVRLGLNLHTLEGNMAYGRYLYETEGTRPWKYSSKCWGDEREVAIR